MLAKGDCTNLVSSPRYREEIDHAAIELAAGSSDPHRQLKSGKGRDFAEILPAVQQASSQ
jgi:hypothetical protein